MRSSADTVDGVDLLTSASPDWAPGPGFGGPSWAGPISGPLNAMIPRASAATVGTPGGMQINLIFDDPISTLPTDFVAGVEAAAARFAALFTDNITFNLHVGFGEVNGQAMGATALGESTSNFSRLQADQVINVDPFIDANFAETLGTIDVSSTQLAAGQAELGQV